MPSTYYSLHTHVIFSTKNRHPYLTDELLPRTHDYIGGILRTLDAKPTIIGGTADHVHLLFGLKTTQCPANIVREVKKASNEWLKQWHPHFHWQEGYGAFSVSPERLNGVQRYIANQEEHHRHKTFKEEWMELMKLAGIEFDEAVFD
ncbi:MAG TPA: IS200/IS605 family transposase [Fimbriimonas sp.]|nr:IS200/IS605 family transposase [Fimbriimonas sp.]